MITGDAMQRSLRLGLCLPLLMAAPCAALAAEPAPMATRPAVALPATPTAEPGPLPESWEPRDGLAPDVPDGKVHGMVSAGVGTGGYREAAIALNGQLANGATVAIAIDAAQIRPGRVRRDRAPSPPAAN
jgi:hypothetical protein